MSTITQDTYNKLIQSGLTDQKIRTIAQQKGDQIDSGIKPTTSTNQSSKAGNGKILYVSKNGQAVKLDDKGEPTIVKPFSTGIAGAVVNNLPTILSTAGAIGADALAPETGGASILGSGAAGAAGGAAGETLKEKIQGSNLSGKDIAGQGIIGGVFGLIGKAAEPVVGAALDLAKNLPVIGPIIEGISGIGDAAMKKIFGAGDESTYKEGAQSLVDTAKKFKLDNTSDLDTIAKKTLTFKSQVGEKLGTLIEDATKNGKGEMTASDLQDIIKKSTPLGTDSKAIGDLGIKIRDIITEQAQKDGNLASGEYENLLKGLQDGSYKINANAQQAIKEYLYKIANFGSSSATDAEKLAQGVSIGVKNNLETISPAIKEANQDWWNLSQIKDHIIGTQQNISKIGGGVGATIRPRIPTGSAVTKLTSDLANMIGKVTPKALPQIIGQLVHKYFGNQDNGGEE